jgi:hypothetical protein
VTVNVPSIAAARSPCWLVVEKLPKLPTNSTLIDGLKMFHMCWALSDGSSKLIPIDEQPNHQIVHLFRLGKAKGATHEPLHPGPEIDVLALDLVLSQFLFEAL